MTRINLLPWREELRQERQRQFLSTLGLVAMLGVVVVLAYKYTIGLEIEAQQQRNQYLLSEIAKLDKDIREIKDLEQDRQNLIDRMNKITELQESRPRVVRIFDELVKSIPQGLNFSEVTRQGARLTITGTAESNQRITAFLRKIEASPWLIKPDLKTIGTDRDYGAGRKDFVLILEEKPLSEMTEEAK
ncbi:MAG: PilN domain-containing protein [Kangiellaceae bacterium]|jgi:type IV pilus assembly protein PilN|nr:PilN domain-containing protein [Kangiellaceae bacterium]